MRDFTSGRDHVHVLGSNFAELIDELEASIPNPSTFNIRPSSLTHIFIPFYLDKREKENTQAADAGAGFQEKKAQF
jgi:hypothetical protein